MVGRADPFAGSDDLDLSDFKKQPAARPNVSASAIRQVSEENNFPSRAAPSPSPSPSPAAPRLRRRRTGRNFQINLKVTPEWAARFVALADANGWGQGEAFEKAVEALERQVKA